SPLTSSSLQVGGNLNLGGTLVVSNLSPTPLAAGDSIQVISSAGSTSLMFASIVPARPGAGLAWDTSSLASSGALKVVSIVPTINSIQVEGTNLLMSGTGGPANATYDLLMATNPGLPLAQWVPLSTNNFDAQGR